MAKRKMRYDSHKPTKSKSTHKKVDEDDDGGPTNITSRPEGRVDSMQVMEKQLKISRKIVEEKTGGPEGYASGAPLEPRAQGHGDIPGNETAHDMPRIA
jgi:hypothetical protein